jgi:hypothetical protein
VRPTHSTRPASACGRPGESVVPPASCPRLRWAAVVCSCLAFATARSAENPLAAVEQRARQLVEAALKDPNAAKPNNPIAPWIAIRHLDRGENEPGLQLLYKILDGTPPSRQGHPFSSYALAYAHLKYGHLYDAAHTA